MLQQKAVLPMLDVKGLGQALRQMEEPFSGIFQLSGNSEILRPFLNEPIYTYTYLLSIYLSIYLSIHLSIHPSIYLYLYLYLYIYIYIYYNHFFCPYFSLHFPRFRVPAAFSCRLHQCRGTHKRADTTSEKVTGLLGLADALRRLTVTGFYWENMGFWGDVMIYIYIHIYSYIYISTYI